MRLAFPNGDHEEITIGKGSISIGSSDDDDVVLKAEGVQPGHAVIIIDQRGITLAVDQQGGDIEVNSRPIMQRAILRLGDQVRLQGVQMLLRADDAAIQSVPDGGLASSDEPPSLPAKYHIRGVNGAYQGKVIALADQLSLGSAESADICVQGDQVAAEHISFETNGNDVCLRDLNGSGDIIVNGNSVGSVILRAGDQITVGSDRFVLEAPGFVPGKAFAGVGKPSESSNTQVFSAPVMPQDGDQKSGQKSDSQRQANRQQSNRPKPASGSGSGKRDAIIIAICLVLSGAMLFWLYFNI